MTTVILSNGYVFWSAIGLAAIAGSIYFAASDLSRTDYSSWWGRFLDKNNFIKAFWCTMIVLVCTAAITVVMYAKEASFSCGAPGFYLLAANAVLLVIVVLLAFLMYCKHCWGTLPGEGACWLLTMFGLVYGATLFLSQPAIPKGAVVSTLWEAVKLNLGDETTAWLDGISLTDFQTYVQAMRYSEHWRVAWYVFLGVCVSQLVLRNGWMHCIGIKHRLFCPLATCVLGLAVLSASLLAGFVLTAWSLYALYIVVYVVAGIFAIWFALALFAEWFKQETETGGRGRFSDGTKIKQELGNNWVDENGRRWRDIGGGRFESCD